MISSNDNLLVFFKNMQYIYKLHLKSLSSMNIRRKKNCFSISKILRGKNRYVTDFAKYMVLIIYIFHSINPVLIQTVRKLGYFYSRIYFRFLFNWDKYPAEGDTTMKSSPRLLFYGKISGILYRHWNPSRIDWQIEETLPTLCFKPKYVASFFI